MKRTGIFRYLSMALASLTLMLTLSMGVISIAPKFAYAQEASVVVEKQHQEAGSIVADPAEESLKICKDESGAAKACDDKDLFSFLMISVGGLSGLGALGIAFLISKLLLLLILSPIFSNMFPSLEKGGWKLFIAVTLNMIVGLLSLMVPPVSLSFGAAIMHSSVLALFSVFSNQAYKQFFTAKGKS